MAGEHDPEWFSNAAMFLFVDPLKFVQREEISGRIAALAAYLKQGGARLPGASAKQRQQDTAERGLRLPDHVCVGLKTLAGELGVEIPAALPEIGNAAVGPGTAKLW
jgi:LDH2 family malate/lactate/ureidoglycolate dehydrogenase